MKGSASMLLARAGMLPDCLVAVSNAAESSLR